MSRAARRVVVVTGGTRGIGRAIAERFHEEGDAIAVCSRSAREPALPEAFLHGRVDVRRRDEVQQFIGTVLKAFGSLDVLINCAGVYRWRALEDIDEAFAADLIETNVLGSLWACAAAAPVLSTDGCIVNVSSLAGKRGAANNSVYCATKFAMNGMTQSLAKELGPRGIRVNAVCPVYVETEQLRAALSELASSARGRNVGTFLASFAETQTALGRLPTVQEVAKVVSFLASSAASAITGQCLNVDCGALPQ